jgi:hypothetical protein
VASILAAAIGLSIWPDVSSAGPSATDEKADSLVGSSLVIMNVSRRSGNKSIVKLRSESDVVAARKALQPILNKYPASFIACVLKTIYVGSEIKGVLRAETGSQRYWGGTYFHSDLSMFVMFNGDAQSFESTFHHELAHGIYHAYRQQFNEKAWLAANPPGFTYKGVADFGPSTPELRQQGFMRPYATWNLEEDVACIAQALIGNTEAFAKLAAQNPRLRQKASVLIALYQAVDPIMTEQYFRLQDAAEGGVKEAVDVSRERGRPVLVTPQAVNGVFLGYFKKGDVLTLLYKEKSKPVTRNMIVFDPKSPTNIALCRRGKSGAAADLTVLTLLPSMTPKGAFSYTFTENCAAVLKMNGDVDKDAPDVRYECQVVRGR